MISHAIVAFGYVLHEISHVQDAVGDFELRIKIWKPQRQMMNRRMALGMLPNSQLDGIPNLG